MSSDVIDFYSEKKKIEMFFLKSVGSSDSIRKPMSSSSSYSASASKTKTLCVVCRDAGKSEQEYTSHFVKDQPGPNGKVICPTLLNQACRICGKTGHTSSYCSQYRPRRDEPRREERYIEREERYIEREREPRREERRDISYNRLHEDTERREREIHERDDAYYRAQERRSKTVASSRDETGTTTAS